MPTPEERFAEAFNAYFANFDNQIEPFVIIAADTPVQPIAAAGEKIDPQQPHAIAILHAGIGRIARIARDADAQSMGAGRPHEARATTAERCPSIPRRIDRAHRLDHGHQ